MLPFNLFLKTSKDFFFKKDMIKEVFSVHIGKCGIQLGQEFWKQLCSEHQISPEGIFFSNKKNQEQKDIFFQETANGKFIPRTFLFDLEPRTLNNLANSNYKKLFGKNNIFFSKQSAGNNWAKGYHQGIEFQGRVEEIFRKNVENCNKLSAFNIFHSIAGGTGSGSGSLILEILRDEFPGKFINCYSIIPNQLGAADAVVQPYNSILSFRWLIHYADCVTFFENASMEKIINPWNKDSRIGFKQINALISSIINTSTEHIRFPSFLKNSLESLFAPLIPTPNLHFLSAGVSNSSFLGEGRENSTSKIDRLRQVFENKTTCFPLDHGKLISAFHFLDSGSNLTNLLDFLKKIHQEKNIKYIDWGPVSIQITNSDLQEKKDIAFRNEICLLNHTNLKNFFIETTAQYNALRKRNAFLNNYLKNFSSEDGIELFVDAKETVQSLVGEYEGAESSVFF